MKGDTKWTYIPLIIEEGPYEFEEFLERLDSR